MKDLNDLVALEQLMEKIRTQSNVGCQDIATAASLILSLLTTMRAIALLGLIADDLFPG